MLTHDTTGVARRSFLTRAGLALGLFGGTAVSPAAAQTTAAAGWQPRRHPLDDWMDLPGAHRLVFDTTSPSGLGSAILFGNNFFVGNQNGYSLGNGDLACIIVMRHNSTAFGYSDEMWAKYGNPLASRSNFDDPKTKQRPVLNVFNSAGYGPLLPNNGTTLDALAKRGVHFAVCQMATRRLAGTIAEATGGNAESLYNELVAHLVPNSHIVPAGIVALSRAQERGYTMANGG
jgi:intracellular sulfur oxidation DsrE/DsrF family protein